MDQLLATNSGEYRGAVVIAERFQVSEFGFAIIRTENNFILCRECGAAYG